MDVGGIHYSCIHRPIYLFERKRHLHSADNLCVWMVFDVCFRPSWSLLPFQEQGDGAEVLPAVILREEWSWEWVRRDKIKSVIRWQGEVRSAFEFSYHKDPRSQLIFFIIYTAYKLYIIIPFIILYTQMHSKTRPKIFITFNALRPIAKIKNP